MFLGFLFKYSTKSSHSNSSSYASAPSSSEYFQKKATVVSSLRGFEEGRIRLHGVFWFARLANPASVGSAECGSLVTVVGRERNTLVVRPFSRGSNEKTPCPVVSDSTSVGTCEDAWLN